jgi:hypothetical protein
MFVAHHIASNSQLCVWILENMLCQNYVKSRYVHQNGNSHYLRTVNNIRNYILQWVKESWNGKCRKADLLAKEQSTWMNRVWFMTTYVFQINQPTRCNSFTSLLLDVYVWLNMFRAPPRPSSGAYNCTSSLWFYRCRVAVKPEAASAVVRSWW